MSSCGQIEILLAEDNPSDVELTTRALKKHNLANKMQIVHDGQEALDYLFGEGKYSGRPNNDFPRVILLDLKLPKLSGIEVLRAIRADERTKLILVVVLTSSQEAPDIKESYSLGVNSYIVKPVDFSKFVDSVSNLGFYWLLLNKPPV